MRGKKVLVFGLARSGVGAANLLVSLGAEVTVTDQKPREKLMEFAERLLPSVGLMLGGHPDGIFEGKDLIVISPGVPLDIALLREAKKKGIRIIGELELAYQLIQGSGVSDCGAAEGTPSIPNPQSLTPFLAVTGTNGKSTTITLLDLMLEKGGYKTIMGGNIGNALTEEIFKKIKNSEVPDEISKLLTIDYIVAEVSSFQLESIDTFKPRGAAILNITPDHGDRYHSIGEYTDAKARIFLNQHVDDFLVLNADDPQVIKVEKEKLKVKSGKPKVYYFSRQKAVNGIYYKDGIIYSNFVKSPFSTLNPALISADEIKIKGVHNLENAMAASAMALLAKCPADAVVGALKEFPGLEHRLEFIRELDGVSYINDSKGTNVGAVVKSLESFSKPIILIAGGRDKEGDFSVLSPLVKSRVKTLILIGEAREKIKKALGGMTETKFADDLEDAVKMSKRCASHGDVVILSPACASFDMFKNFEDRGKQFKKIVERLD